MRGTAFILQLARNPDNMEEIVQNGTLRMFLYCSICILYYTEACFLAKSTVNVC